MSVVKRQAEAVIQFHVKVSFELKKEGDWFIASCCPLDVHSQGKTADQAVANLAEAIELFLESCYERGTLEQVLKESGFSPAHGERRYAGDQRRGMLDIPLPALIANKKNAEARTC